MPDSRLGGTEWNEYGTQPAAFMTTGKGSVIHSKSRNAYSGINMSISTMSPLSSPLILRAKVEIHVSLSGWKPYLPPASRSGIPINHFGHLSFDGSAYEQAKYNQEKKSYNQLISR